MDSAKDIAKDMLDAINVKGTGFIGAVAKGFISLPVNLVYMGYDFFDVENRRGNLDDKYRIAELIKRTPFDLKVLEKVINVFVDDFISRVNVPSIGVNLTGSFAGKVIFTEWTGVKLGYVISEKASIALVAGTTLGALLSLGAEASRAIYTSRYLRESNPMIYYKLRDMGDLDLLYLFVEDTVEPFETACRLSESDPAKFDKVCEYFFGGI